jgi:ornithine cyclodeaminase/alanine dehydrogenase-like protein (mu-crystallin family)
MTSQSTGGAAPGSQDVPPRAGDAPSGPPVAPSHAGRELLHIGPHALRERLGLDDAIAALEAAFAGQAHERAIERERHDVDGGELLVMPAAGAEGVGVKLVTIAPANGARGLPLIHGLYVLFRAQSLEPEALIDGGALTAFRTAAVSALATKHLARPDARRLVVFGAGAQAEAHVEAMTAVRPIEHVVVVGRGRDRAAELVARLRAAGLDAEVGAAEAVSEADIVCTCTTSSTPVFDGERLARGAHVNAIGAYRPDLCEIDAGLLARARVVVEERAAALAEAGDLLQAIGTGRFTAGALAGDLAEVVQGRVRRNGGAEVTVFKSVGLALEDLVVARAAVSRAARSDGVAATGARA